MAVLLGEYLDVKYDLVAVKGTVDFHFAYGSQNLTIANCFFDTDDLSLLYTSKHLPIAVTKEDVDIGNSTLPICLLYGKNILTSSAGEVHYQGDIISSSFFMLSRWEESLAGKRDEHGRFTAEMSLAGKHDFLQRPIVNEYVEVLWQLLLLIGYDKSRKVFEYKCVPTHDVDHPFMWSTELTKGKSLAAKLVKGRVGELGRSIAATVEGRDPWDTFDLLMDKAESVNTKASFFFMAEGQSKWDGKYKLDDPAIKRLIEKIESRGHHLGLHPSYDTIENTALLTGEKSKLEKHIAGKCNTGRQHFLRFELPATWQMWEQNQMSWDSTLGYADQIGFRCGTCYPFSVFDVTARQHLNLVERPLLVMDVTVQKYNQMSPAKAIASIKAVQQLVKQYGGEFVFLWHNSSFFTDEWIDFESTWKACYN